MQIQQIAVQLCLKSNGAWLGPHGSSLNTVFPCSSLNAVFPCTLQVSQRLVPYEEVQPGVDKCTPVHAKGSFIGCSKSHVAVLCAGGATFLWEGLTGEQVASLHPAGAAQKGTESGPQCIALSDVADLGPGLGARGLISPLVAIGVCEGRLNVWAR